MDGGNKKQYMSWMRLEAATPPRSTAHRYQRQAGTAQQVAVTERQQTAVGDHNQPPEEQRSRQQMQMEADDDLASAELMSLDSESSVSTAGGDTLDESSVSTDDGDAFDEPHSSVGSEDGEIPEKPENEHFVEEKVMQNLNEPITASVNCTGFECLLMVLAFAFRHGLTKVACADLCKLINTILGGQFIPTSKYMLKKLFGSLTYHYNFFCTTCDSYIGQVGNKDQRIDDILHCPTCDAPCYLKTLNDGNFFLTFPLKEQLRIFLENFDDVHDTLNYRWTRQHDNDLISDVFDGKCYKKLVDNNGFLSEFYNMSLTFNTDGAPVYKSTKSSLWPIHFRVNEMPPWLRFEQRNSLIGGLWFGKKEPSMSLFLSVFVKELNSLYQDGLQWKLPTGEIVESKFILLNCVVDSKAKPLVQNTKQFNGYYGCGYCYHPGVILGNEGSSQVKYPVNDDLVLFNDNGFSYTVTKFSADENEEKTFNVTDRDNETLRKEMEQAENLRGDGMRREDVRGVKGLSPLYPLIYFDLVFGFGVDYLHCVLLGVVRLMTNLWIDSSSNGKSYYIGRSIDKVDSRLLSITPPTCISRRPRSLSDRVHWKGNEWRSWLLFYSVPCFKGILPPAYLNHYCLLVTSIYILLKENISRRELDQATWYLGEFCLEFMRLYPRSLMHFNVHLLLHLGKCVDHYGPLFCFSAFSFESSNGYLVKLVQGTKGVVCQIGDKYLQCKATSSLVKKYNVTERTLQYCQDLLCYRTAQVVHVFGQVTILGAKKSVTLIDSEAEAMRKAGLNVTSSCYERMVKGKVMYHAKCYSRKGKKSDDSVVWLKCGSFAVIERILDPQNVDTEPGPLLLIREINVEKNVYVASHQCGANVPHIRQCSLVLYCDFKVIQASDVVSKAIFMKCEDDYFLSTFPNTYEKD